MRFNGGVEVPAGWGVVPLKRVTRFGYGEALASDDRQSGQIKVYGSNGPFDSHSTANTLAPCIIVGRKGSYGKIQFSEEPVFAVDTTFVVDRRHTAADLRFLYYLLGILGLDELSDDTAVPGLSREKAYQSLAPLPPLETQQRIARFLDEKVARIDGLIEKKRALLNRLAEKRQALITRAVTKGLNPAAPMKPSGIDWLGDIPAHWVTCGLGQKIKLQRGVDITKNERVDGDVPVVSSGGIDYFHDTALCFGPGVLIGRKGSAGKLHYVSSNYWPHDTTLYVREFRGNSPRFTWYLLHCIDLVSFDSGSSNPTVNRNRVHPVQTAWPQPEEQHAIAAYLDEQLSQVADIEERVEASIAHLIEYRFALMTTAVSGRIEGTF